MITLIFQNISQAPEYKKLASYGTVLWRGGRKVLLCHSLQHSHEGGDEAVNIALVLHARRLQDHESAEQLWVSSCCRLLVVTQALIHDLNTDCKAS